jgi:hypothetical protein
MEFFGDVGVLARHGSGRVAEDLLDLGVVYVLLKETVGSSSKQSLAGRALSRCFPTRAGS